MWKNLNGAREYVSVAYVIAQKTFALVSHGGRGGVLILTYVANVFQTDDMINSEPKIKRLEPVLLPGKR